MYCLRQVDVLQKKSDTPCFISTISFKRDETASGKWQFSEHQGVPNDHIKKEYASDTAGHCSWQPSKIAQRRCRLVA